MGKKKKKEFKFKFKLLNTTATLAKCPFNHQLCNSYA